MHQELCWDKKEAEDKTTYRFYCEDIHDFAWSADTDFVEVWDEFEGTKIRLLHQSGHEGISGRIIESIKATLDYYGDYYQKYPWPQITCIDSPIYPAVMEYPTLFVTGNYTIDGVNADPGLVPETDRFLEMLTIHEFGHNWYQGLIGNNETEEMWLDESLNSYATLKAFEQKYGPVMLKREGRKDLTLRRFEIASYQHSPQGMVTKKAWEFDNHTEVFVMCYPKGMLLFTTFENYYGSEKFADALKSFFQEWKFKHPTKTDLMNALYDKLGREFEPFVQQYLYTSHTLDYSIDKQESNKVTIKKDGELIFPVDISIELADGKVEKRHWDGNGQEYAIEVNKEITSVNIDPDYIIEFELDRKNNTWNKEE